MRLDFDTLALGLLAALPYNGVIQTDVLSQKPAISHQNTDIMSWKSKKEAFWIDFWIYEGKTKKELDHYEHKQIHN